MDYDLNYQPDTGDVDVSAIPNKIGDLCLETGNYECSTCGDEQAYTKDTKFPGCDNCGDEYLTWELLSAA